jgi:hypothetical protein
VRKNIQMRMLLTRIEVPGAVLGIVVLLTSGGIAQAKSQGTQTRSPGGAKAAQQLQIEDIPLCSGASSASSAGQGHSQGNPHSHSVALSWNAAAPASNSPRDAIKGYYVYKSLAAHTYAESNRISESPLPGTRCVDTNVEPRKTYFYVVKTVTESGEQSSSSLEIKAVVPFP